MADEQIRIDVTANDKASDKLEDVADAAKALEKLDPEVDVTADTGSATADLTAAGEAAEALSRADHEILLRARIDDAKGELKSLRSELDQTGEKAEDTARRLDRIGGDGGGGLQTRGNAIADLTGPLGEASGAASDFAGVFEGLGDIAGDVASKLGASQRTAQAVVGAIGGLGVAASVAAAGWALYQGRQQKAREESEKMTAAIGKLNDALEAQDARKWGEQFVESFPKAKQVADALGLSMRDVALFITGQADEIPRLDSALAGMNASMVDAGLSQEDAAAKTQVTTDMLIEAREQYAQGQVDIGKFETAVDGAARAMPTWTTKTDAQTDAVEELTAEERRNQAETERTTRLQEEAAAQAQRTTDAYSRLREALDIEATAERFREDFLYAIEAVQTNAPDASDKVRTLKDDIITAAEQTKQNPIEVKATLDAVDRGDMDRVKADVEAYYARNPVSVRAVLARTGATTSGSGGGTGGPIPQSAPTTVVQMNVPRGYRGDLLGDARRATRRTGRYYQHAGL